MSQEGCRITKKNSQNWIHIYVFPFKAMAIMASFLFFHSYEYQGIQTKSPFDEVVSLNFDLGHLKVNTYGIK
jgi:hypothetical protein